MKVLAVDLDPQANLSQALMGERAYRTFLDDKSPSIVEVFNGYQPPADRTSPTALDVDEVVRTVSSGTRGELRIIPSRFDFSDNLISASNTNERALARLIADNLQDYDMTVIDCAPTESVLTRAAYHASRYVLVPVRPEYFATIGFPLLSDSLDAFERNNRGHRIDVIGVVINNAFYDGGNDGGPEKSKAMADIASDARERSWHIFEAQIPHSRGFPKIMRGDRTWLGNAPRFRDFADEFMFRLIDLRRESL